MSKPKPGLGKGIVRTLSHAHPSSSTSSAGHHGALGHREYHTASRSGLEGRKEYTSGTWRESSASFSTIGLPHSGSSTVGAGSSSSWLPSGSMDDIVMPFRPSRLGRKPHPSARALFSTTSSTSSPSISLPMSPASLPPLWGLNMSSLSSYLSLPSLTAKVNAAFSEFGFGDLGHSGDLLPSLYPQPGARPPRSTDPHFALSPNDTSPSAPFSDPTFHPAFGTLGLPFSQSVEPLNLAPMGMEGSALNLYTSNLIFHLGASGLAKERPVYHGRPRPQSAPPPPRPRSFPLPEVTPPLAADIRSTSVGEDAYFARMDGMCIADGVGGWARSGRGEADAGRWSRLLTHFCEMEVVDWWAGKGDYAVAADPASLTSEEEAGRRMEAGLADEGPSGWASKAWKRSTGQGSEERVEEAKRRPLDPVEIMQRGYEKCLSCVLAEGIHGSSTCLLALLHHSTLLVANLGDCCLLLIRGGQIVLRTDEMQHAFNFPLQLGTHSRDEPMKDAKRYDISVRKGDVVVVGSDGLMDNLFDEDILDTLAQFAPPTSQPYPTPPSSRPTTPGGLPSFSPQKVSEALCKRARAVSEQTSSMTPFMVKAIEEGIDFVGGKKDDISVLVGVIGDRDDSGPNPGLALHTE